MGDDLTSTLTLSTDQTDYAPGSTATFTVDGVTAGDTYDFVVTDIYGNPVSGTNLPWDVVANADGTLTTTWAVGMDALGEAFQVTVVDETTGQIATASFTDGLHAPVQADVFVGTTDTGGTTVGNGLVFLTGDVNTSTGTGIFPSFVLIQNTGTEEGFNTDFRPAVEDTNNSPVHDHSITLGDVPIVTGDGTNGALGVDYREFRLDLNESQSSVATARIILEALQIFGQTAIGDPTVDGKLSTFTEFAGGTTGGTLAGAFEIYNMDGTDGHTGDGITDVSALLQSWATGSGHSDYKVLIPNSFFANLSNTDFIYLYSKFAGADGGFEEWSVGPASPQQPPTPHAALSIDKEIVCDDGDNVTGGTVLAGSKIDFTYSLFDVGDTGSSVQGITLTDSVLGTIYANGAVDSTLASTHTVTFTGDTNNNGKLDFGENWVFTVSDLAVAGNYMNTAEATGTDNAGVALTQDSLPATYFGADPEMQVTKLTNGVAHPDVIAGQLVTWTYTVHNTGNVDLTDLTLTDNNGGGLAIPFAPSQVQVLFNGNFYNVGDTNHDGILNPGETWDFTASGTAKAVVYANTVTVDADTSIDGSVVLTDACGDSLSIEDTASSGYTGHAQTLAGLTKGYWATHLTLWDVTTGDEKGAGSELNVTPHYDWNESGGITTSAITTSGSSSSLGLVKGANNGGGDSGLLLGDLNHDGLLTGDGSSGHIFFDLASAQTIANSSVSGDARLILASQAVAAQLNEYNDYVYDQTHGGPPSGLFDASPTGLIEEAVQWLNGTGPLSPNGHSKINWSTANDVAGITTIINDGTPSTNDYTLSGGAITFKSTAMSSSDASWTHFATMLSGYTPGTDASGNPISNPSNFNTVQADGEGLKNALAAYNHGLDGSGGGFVISTDGSLIGWQDTAGGQVYDVHANTQDAFWGILEDQNLLGHTVVGVTGVHT